ncbi:MAG: sulfatase-like hydrolase/transferase, partial [Chitinophagales bacterium]|nr:sulfatase-like hydrolase/transferase [Chitinophagales bacterium]
MLHMCLAVAQPADKPNIIIITYDDMNDWVSNLQGQPQSLTPNLDSIAKLGTTFLNTFCNAPVCAPSRTSWLTGKSPHYTQVYNNEEYISEDFRENFPEDKQIITLPQYLKDSVGYYTVSMNKIFHAQQFKPDFDSTNIDACSRSLSWNDVVLTNNLGGILNAGDELNEDVKNFEWAMIDDSFTTRMKDYTVVDEAALLLDDYTT